MRKITRNSYAGGDLGPALWVIALMLTIMLLMYTFDPNPSDVTVYGDLSYDDMTPEQQKEADANKIVPIELAAMGMATVGAGVGTVLLLPGIGTAIGAVTGFCIGLFGSLAVMQDSGITTFLSETWNTMVKLLTFDITPLDDFPVLRILFGVFFFIGIIWIARRIILG